MEFGEVEGEVVILKTETMNQTKKSFGMSVVAFLLLILSIIMLVLAKKYNVPPFMVGVPCLLAFLAGAIGFIFSIKSLKEENSSKKILSPIFNSFLLVCMVAFILGDLLK